MSKFYVTTAIPFVNAEPHIGFALELVQADVIARALREQHGSAAVRFVTGTDENAIKNVQAAEKAGVPIKEFVDKNAGCFKELAEKLSISNDDFIRTTEERHVKGAQKLWQACKKDTYQKEYEGLYCVGCEQFYLEKDLADGLCPEHKTKPERVKEKNYFFALSRYAPFLKAAFAEGKIRIHPKSRQNEITSFVKEGLEDFSVSRSNVRAKNWGVDIPGDSSQKMYVWFDALSNYINALGYADNDPAFKEFWLAEDAKITHVIGKGITRFHAVYWPAMLESAGIFPKNGLDIFVHGYVTIGGEKISKTVGNVIDPFALISTYGADAVRYFLLREIPTFEDGDFTEGKLRARYTGELANGLGNLVQRTIALAEKNHLADIGSQTGRFFESLQKSWNSPNFASYKLDRALDEAWKLVTEGNQYVDAEKVWEKKDNEARTILADLAVLILHIADSLRIFAPDVAKKIYARFGVPFTTHVTPENAGTLKLAVKKGEPLFPRVQ